MSRPLRIGLLAAVLLVSTPSSAAAVVLRVDPSGAGGAFKTIGAAVAAAGPGDTVAVSKGDYAESVTIPAFLTNLQVTGADGARVLGGTGPEDVLRIEAASVDVKTLSILAPTTARSGVRVGEEATANLIGVSVIRTDASQSTVPLVDIAGGATLEKSLVVQQAGGAGAPAVAALSDEGSEIVDTKVSTSTGPAFLVREGEANLVRRSTLLSTAAGGDAVRLAGGEEVDRGVLIESSELVAADGGAGVRVLTQGLPAEDTTAVALRHVTVFGGDHGLHLDATVPTNILGLPEGTAGSITATVNSSIVRERSFAKGAPGGLLSPGNTVTLAFADSDTPGVAAGDRNARAAVSTTRVSYTPDATRLFGTGLHLRADAPVIDKGPKTLEDGESDKDIDGQARLVGAATDLGADEFVNGPPRAALSASTATPAQRETVTFTSSATDPDAGDAVAAYHWDFGDGNRVATTVPTVSHAYERPGAHTVSLAVVDRGGLPSDVATTTVTVRDVDPPTVSIAAPKARSTFLQKRSKRSARRLRMQGTDSDVTGIAKVEVSLRRLGRRTCRHYSGRRLVRDRCTSLRWVTARLDGEGWRLLTRRGVRLTPGRYQLQVRATDVGGAVSVPSADAGSVVRFEVKKRPRGRD